MLAALTIVSLGMSIADQEVPYRPVQVAMVIRPSLASGSFTRVTQVSVSPGGNVLLVDQAERTILQFDRSGSWIRSIGGPDAPVQFQSAAIGWLSDTLYAIDAAAGRISFFTTAGAFLRDTLLNTVDMPNSGTTFAVVRLFDGGRMIAVPRISPSSMPADYMDSLVVPFVAVDAAGVRKLADVRVSTADLLAVPRPDGEPLNVTKSSLGKLLGRGHQWTVTNSGGVVLAQTLENSNTFMVTSIGFGGDTTFRRSFTFDPIPVQPHLVDSLVLDLARRLRGVPRAQAIATVREVVGVLDRYPAVTLVLAGPDGSIWVGRESIEGQPKKWLVLSETGEPLFETRTPAEFRGMLAGAGGLWGVESDSLGALSIRHFVTTAK